jgi:hypothetical protein
MSESVTGRHPADLLHDARLRFLPTRPSVRLPSSRGAGFRRWLLLMMGGIGVAMTAGAQTVVVNDAFDDGVVTSNANGVGTGFNFGTQVSGASVVETGGALVLTTNINGARRAYATSKDGAAVDSEDTFARFEFRGLSFAQNTANGGTGAADRLYFGVKDSSAATDMTSNPDTGFYIQIESDSIATAAGDQSWNGKSALFYESSTDTRTLLATWTFATLNWDDNVPANFNFSPSLDLTLDLNKSGYALGISGDSINLLSGSLSGTFASAGIANELSTGHGTLFQQIEGPGLITKLDHFSVTADFVAIPEPSTYALLGLGSLALFASRLRRAGRSR